MEQIEINRQAYQILKLLGTGGYGKVYLATPVKPKTGYQIGEDTLVVIKQIITTPEKANTIKNEIAVLAYLTDKFDDRSPFNRLLDYSYSLTDDSFSANLVLEYIEGRELLDFILKDAQKMGRQQRHLVAGKITLQLLQAVSLLHKNLIYHRDLKLENIMIVQNGESDIQIVIIDFGLSCSLSDVFVDRHKQLSEHIKTCHNLRPGTLHYAAPQIFDRSRELTLNDVEKADIWACGVVLFALLYNTFPFDEKTFAQTRDSILNFGRSGHDFREMLQKSPSPYERIILSIFSAAAERPGADELIKELQKIVKVLETRFRF